MMEELGASRIRELLLDFYQRYDAQRLSMGLDIFSMVVWTQQNGLDSLNELLFEQYGAKIDPNARIGGTNESFQRFSALLGKGGESDDQQRRNHVYAKLVEFYEAKDPSKIGRLNDFVQYIMMHGIDSFNRKLVAKYGVGLVLAAKHSVNLGAAHNAKHASMGSSFTISTLDTHSQMTNGSNESMGRDIPATPPKKKTPPALPAKRKESPKPQAREVPAYSMPDYEEEEENEDEDLEIDLDELPPPPPDGEDYFAPPSFNEMRAKLTAYYKAYDPAKIEHLDSILEWGMQIGEEELEAKLNQIYGFGFADALEEQKKQDAATKSTAAKVRNSITNAAVKVAKALPQPPKRQERKNEQPSQQAPTKPQQLQSSKPAPVAPKKIAAAPKKNGSPPRQRQNSDASDAESGPCNFYELDMAGKSFGVCKCGYSRMAHTKGSPEHAKATQKKQSIAHNLATEVRQSAFSPQQSRSRAATQPKQDREAQPKQDREAQPKQGREKKHDKRDKQPNDDNSVLIRAGGGEKGGDKACNNFQLDMAAGSFAVCECGFKRDQHKATNLIKRISKTVTGKARK